MFATGHCCLETSPVLTPECCAATECFLYSSASAAMPEYAAGLKNFAGEGHWGYLEAAMQKCCTGLCRRCSLGYFTMETCLQREKGFLHRQQMPLPPSTPNFERKCSAFQLGQKKTMSLLKTHVSVPWLSEGVLSKLDLVFPWTCPAVEESHWKGRSAEQDLPIVNNQWFPRFFLVGCGLFLFTVNRSPLRSGRSFNKSLTWTCIFSYFSVNP